MFRSRTCGWRYRWKRLFRSAISATLRLRETRCLTLNFGTMFLHRLLWTLKLDEHSLFELHFDQHAPDLQADSTDWCCWSATIDISPPVEQEKQQSHQLLLNFQLKAVHSVFGCLMLALIAVAAAGGGGGRGIRSCLVATQRHTPWRKTRCRSWSSSA